MSDNLISRQHVTYTIDKYISGFDAIDANFLDGLKTAKKLIKELPSVQPEIIFEDVKKYCEKRRLIILTREFYDEMKRTLQSVQQERMTNRQWTPVTEALPEDGVTVWVTIKGHDVIRCEDGETLEQAIARISRIRWVTQGYWSEEEHGWNDPSFGCPLMVQPVAWMPMEVPEPYKGGQND